MDNFFCKYSVVAFVAARTLPRAPALSSTPARSSTYYQVRRLATSPRHSTMVKAVKRKVEDLGYHLAESKSLQEMTPQELKYMNAEFDMVANNKKLAERAIKMLTDQKGIGVGCQVDLFEHGLQTATRCYNDLIARTKVRACRTSRRAPWRRRRWPAQPACSGPRAPTLASLRCCCATGLMFRI